MKISYIYNTYLSFSHTYLYMRISIRYNLQVILEKDEEAR